jgi:multidrug resistance efflux pump
MIAFLLTIYVAVALGVFKLKLLKPRPYPIAGVVLAGIFVIGGVIVAWTMSAPMSGDLVTTQYVVQLVPYVKGQVKAVYAKANQPMKKGDLLLEIDPAPYQYTVNQVEAQLNAAKATVQQAEAGVAVTEANVSKAKADVSQAQAAFDQAKSAVANAQASLDRAKAADDLAKTEEQIALNVQKSNAAAISKLNVARAIQNRLEADAAVQQAQAGVAQAQAAQQQAAAGLGSTQSAVLQAEASDRQATFTLEVARSNVPGIEAQLGDARFNLAQCKMTAPSDGYVVNWQVQEGTMLVPAPVAAAGTFVDTSSIAVFAVFPQNWLQNVRPGDHVEMVLYPYPGRMFLGKVDAVIPASGGGQLAPSGEIPNAIKVASSGAFAVRILFEDQAVSRNLSIGSGGTAAVYTDKGKSVHIVSKVAIRMKKWLLYLVPS